MKALVMALSPKKPGGFDSKEKGPSDSEEKEPAEDYKQIAKDAAKDGDFDAMVDALCAYLGK